MTAGQTLPSNTAAPMAASTSGTSSSNSSNGSSENSATVSADDFLTLLVTELQNQDPTEQTDPNEYINQLVEVNSLEQLISINQTLSTDLGGSSGASNNGTSPDVITAASNADNSAAPASVAAGPPTASHVARSPLSASPNGAAPSGSAPRTASHVMGNLSVPDANPAAQSVAHALTRPTHAAVVQGVPSASQ